MRKACGASLVDHHVHCFSAAASRLLERELNLPQPLPPLTVEELVPVLLRDDVARAAVLSTAYLFGGDRPDRLEDAGAIAAENDGVAGAVAGYPARLAGFFSVNPLAESAFPEIERCSRQSEFTGLKLQLTNAGFDWRDRAHVARLAQVFEAAGTLGLVIVLHMRTGRGDYGREDACVFLDEVLPRSADVPVQLAHAGGWGGYDAATDGALGAFADRARQGLLPGRVFFDLSAVVRQVRRPGRDGTGPAGAPDPVWSSERRYERLAERLRVLGLDRFLFGTDWPDWTPQAYVADLRANLPLEDEEMRVLLSNRAHWLS